MQMYTVGGCVRDELLGVPSKDIDFTVVLDDFEKSVAQNGGPFEFMQYTLEDMGFEIFLSTPEFLTVRAQFPTGDGGFDVARAGGKAIPGRKRLTADFVLARKESDYTDGRRPDVVVPGTLEDDLARRDFTMNAIAKDSAGNLIDPFNGQADIEAGMIRCVGDPDARLAEDALRAVRALRFSVTKIHTMKNHESFPDGFQRPFVIHYDLAGAMEEDSVLNSIANKISDERIQIELSKMFRFDTVKSLRALAEFPRLTEAMFAGNVSLDATMKMKGRGK